MLNDLEILLVDDEEDILEFLKYNLDKAGYKTTLARNGKEALVIAANHDFDLIVLDIMMPEMDGVEVCQTLRRRERTAHTLITFLTARSEDFTQIAALNSGADDFITKPIKPAVFLSRIQALLRRHPKYKESIDDNILQLGDLFIDNEKLVLKLKDQEIHLAKKEFELLLLLVSKPGKVFSREEILQKIWGQEVIVVNRTIDVHIRKLREKLGDNYIRTLKGIGYKFDY